MGHGQMPPRGSPTPHLSQNFPAPLCHVMGCTAWSQCKEGAGGLPQPCPETQALGLKALEHKESTKKSKKLRH